MVSWEGPLKTAHRIRRCTRPVAGRRMGSSATRRFFLTSHLIISVSTKPPDNQVTECGGDIYRCEKCGDEKPGFAWRLMLQVISQYERFGVGGSPTETFYRRNNFE